jgi:hypothetical protein
LVVRRNGKVFLTGNSGFPNSLDVSRANDKAAAFPLLSDAKGYEAIAELGLSRAAAFRKTSGARFPRLT